MDIDQIGNGEIYKSSVLSDIVPSSTTAIAHLINNPIDECQITPLLSSSTRDSGCYSSTAAEEWYLMQPHLSMTNNNKNNQKQNDKQRKSSTRLERYNSSRCSSESEPYDKIIINVSGLRFESRASTLQRFPRTLLGDKLRRADYFDYMNNEYFFERHRSSFEAILYFYQSGGRLTRPESISAEIFLEEIKFFDLGDEVLKRYRKQEGYVEEIPVERPVNHIQRKVWEAFECPESSNVARVIAIISIVMIIVSIASFIIETLPSIRNEMTAPSITVMNNITNEQEILPGGETKMFWLFFIIETICVTWFCLELICRFFVAPSKFAFIKNGPNIIDVVSIIPYFLQLIGLIYQNKDSGVSGFSSTLTVLRIIRLVRVFRIFKLSRHFKGLQVLALTFLASWKELLLLMFFLFIIVVVFSSFMYFVEADYTHVTPLKPSPSTLTTSSVTTVSYLPSSMSSLSDVDVNQPTTTQSTNQFLSIPHSFWFAIITMTTVGYGDYVPRTNLGKVIGAICALTGVLTIALPVPIIVSNFTYFYQRQLEDTERQYQASQRAQAGQQDHDKSQFGVNNDKDHGPEYNEWETILSEPDYSDYRDITHAVTKRLVRNAYFKAFRGSKKMSPAMRYQNLSPSSPPHQVSHRIYQANDDRNGSRHQGSQVSADSCLSTSIEFSYHLVKDTSSPTSFSIDTRNGRITVTRELDREIQSFYKFYVESFNHKNHQTSQTEVHINILDENDHYPIFDNSLNNAREQYIYINKSLSLSRRHETDQTTNNIFIARIYATDEDDGSNGVVNYYFTNNDNYAFFHLYSNGSIVLYNQNNLQLPYRLEICARDQGNPKPQNSKDSIVIYICDGLKREECPSDESYQQHQEWLYSYDNNNNNQYKTNPSTTNFYLGSVFIMISILLCIVIIIFCIVWNLIIRRHLKSKHEQIHNNGLKSPTESYNCRMEARKNLLVSDSLCDSSPIIDGNHRLKSVAV
ncbi:unnamed protein product [Adineta steineri]|uniref:Cadherin domain-containing protein n=1 Tax=Adineta steineri TaxID=433720 RepID=A0A813N225_9BILA|nr:unnamed protein product [Adineta steineri]